MVFQFALLGSSYSIWARAQVPCEWSESLPLTRAPPPGLRRLGSSEAPPNPRQRTLNPGGPGPGPSCPVALAGAAVGVSAAQLSLRAASARKQRRRWAGHHDATSGGRPAKSLMKERISICSTAEAFKLTIGLFPPCGRSGQVRFISRPRSL
jgi:hypothetical protein